MSPKLRDLSGNEVIEVLGNFGFEVEAQKGSHVKLSRTNEFGDKETLIIPDHKHIAKGTLSAILRQASAYVPKSALERYYPWIDKRLPSKKPALEAGFF